MKSIKKLSIFLLLIVALFSMSTTTASAAKIEKNYGYTLKAKKTIELSNYIHDKSVKRVTNAISGMKKKSSKNYKSYASRSKLSVGILKNAPNPYNPLKKHIYTQFTDISNTGYIGVKFYGIKIGDSYKTVKNKLSKHGYFPTTGNKYSFYAGNAATLNTKFKSGKLSSYRWKLRYTS